MSIRADFAKHRPRTKSSASEESFFESEASEIHVRSYVGDEGNSGRVVLNVSFVESDP